jgi:hypothetical protein
MREAEIGPTLSTLAPKLSQFAAGWASAELDSKTFIPNVYTAAALSPRRFNNTRLNYILIWKLKSQLQPTPNL